MKKIIAYTLILSMLSTTGVMCFAENETPAAISKIEKVLGKIDAPASEKAEIKKDLEAVKNGENLTPQQKETVCNRIKNFFKKHWKKVVAIGSVVVSTIILIIGSIICLFVGKHYYDKKKRSENNAIDKFVQAVEMDDWDTARKALYDIDVDTSSREAARNAIRDIRDNKALHDTKDAYFYKLVRAAYWLCYTLVDLELGKSGSAEGDLVRASEFLQAAGVTDLRLNIYTKDVETVHGYIRAIVPILQEAADEWCGEPE